MKHFATILLFALALTAVLGHVQETIHRVEEAVENIKHQAQEILHKETHKDDPSEEKKDWKGTAKEEAERIAEKVKNGDTSSSSTDDEEKKKGLKDRIKEGIKERAEDLVASRIKDRLHGDKDNSDTLSSSDTSDEEKKKGLKDRIKEGVEHIVEKVRSHKKDKEDKSDSDSSDSSDKGGLKKKIKMGVAGLVGAGVGKYGDKIAEKLEPENDEGVVNKARGVAADGLHAYAKVIELQEDIAKVGINIAKDALKEELHLSHDDKHLKDRLEDSYNKIKDDVVGIKDNIIDGVDIVTDHGSSNIGQKIRDAASSVGEHIQEGIDTATQAVNRHGHAEEVVDESHKEGASAPSSSPSPNNEGGLGSKIKDVVDSVKEHIYEGIDRVKQAVHGQGHTEEVIDELNSRPEDQFKDESQRIGRAGPDEEL